LSRSPGPSPVRRGCWCWTSPPARSRRPRRRPSSPLCGASAARAWASSTSPTAWKRFSAWPTASRCSATGSRSARSRRPASTGRNSSAGWSGGTFTTTSTARPTSRGVSPCRCGTSAVRPSTTSASTCTTARCWAWPAWSARDEPNWPGPCSASTASTAGRC